MNFWAGLTTSLGRVRAERDEQVAGLVVVDVALVDDGDLPLVARQSWTELVDDHGAGGSAAENEQALHEPSRVFVNLHQDWGPWGTSRTHATCAGRYPPGYEVPLVSGPRSRTGHPVPTLGGWRLGDADGSSGRDLRPLPKAHLHLHFTGAMRHATLIDLAERHRVHLPDALRRRRPPELRATDERGWFRFQRLYDTARSVLREPEDLYRLLREVAEDEVADGSRWLEIQVDPSGYAARFDGLTATFELILDAACAQRRRPPGSPSA